MHQTGEGVTRSSINVLSRVTATDHLMNQTGEVDVIVEVSNAQQSLNKPSFHQFRLLWVPVKSMSENLFNDFVICINIFGWCLTKVFHNLQIKYECLWDSMFVVKLGVAVTYLSTCIKAYINIVLNIAQVYCQEYHVASNWWSTQHRQSCVQERRKCIQLKVHLFIVS